MRRRTLVFVALSTLVAGASSLPALSQDAAENTDFEGRVELLYRSVSVDGSERKYDEDYDGLDSGTRLGELMLNWTELSTTFADYARLEATGLGGDPYERTALRIGRQDVYKLSVTQTSQDYLYNLFELVPDDDGHSWDTTSSRTDVDLSVYLTDAIELVVGYDDWDRSGNSIFVKDLERDVFLLEAPVDRRQRQYSLGANFQIGRGDLIVRQTLRRFRNIFENVTEGNAGLNTTNQSRLDAYDWVQDEESDAWLTSATLLMPLGKRIHLHVGYYGTLLGDEELTSRVSVDSAGVAFSGTAFTVVDGYSSADIDQSVQLIDVDLGVDILTSLTAHLQYRTLQQDASGTLVRDLEATGTPESVSVTNDWNIDTITALLDFRPISGLALRAGYRTIDRELERDGFGSVRDEDFESNGDDTLILGASWRANRWLRLSADHEEGDIDASFTTISPLERSHTRARVTVTPVEALQVTGSYLDFENERQASTFDARSEGNAISLSVNYAPSPRWNAMLGYTMQEIETVADSLLDRVSTPESPDRSSYESDADVYQLSLSYQRRRVGRASRASCSR
ncbi:MAG: hypothetical protein HC882_07285, partial [Acidobacteria bacterium]|nr:hypothetical protein [Acidobacteriota bacterium]